MLDHLAPNYKASYTVPSHNVLCDRILEDAGESAFDFTYLSTVDSELTVLHTKFGSDGFAHRCPVEQAISLVERAERRGHKIRFRPQDLAGGDDDDPVYSSADTSDRFREYANAVTALGLPGLFLLPLIF